MTEDDLKKIEAMMAHQVGIAMEDARHHFAILGEGHQMLVERIDRMENRIDGRIDGLDARLQRVESKVDRVAADLSAHRADTEAHRGIYGVRES
jgi:hypothetical protein